MLKTGGAAGLAKDGGSLEFEVRQLPVRRGSSSFQGLEDAAGGGVVGMSGSSRTCVLFLSLWGVLL